MRRCEYAIYRLWFALIVATMEIVDGNPISRTVIRLERSNLYTHPPTKHSRPRPHMKLERPFADPTLPQPPPAG